MPTTPERLPPHSVEAEEYLIACCFLDGRETISKAKSGEIVPETFFVPANRVIWSKLLDLYDRETPIDLQIIAEELKTSRQLEEVGGYAYLMQVSASMPTTARQEYFIEKLRQLHQTRILINTATLAVERCHTVGSSEDLEKVVNVLKSVGKETTPLGRRLEAQMLNMQSPPKQPEPRYLINGRAICTPGNLTTIIAQAKTGKTAFIGAFLASSFVAEYERQGVEIDCIDTLGVEARSPTTTGDNGQDITRVLIHIDTEQSGYDHYMTVKRSLARARLSAAPDWLWSYSLAGWSPEDIRRALLEALKKAERMGFGVFAVIIDGTADMCANVNDMEESNNLTMDLHALAIKYDTSIINVIHRNEGENADQSARGHLGKQLARKSETNLSMKKVDGKTVVFSEQQRGAPILEKDGPCFKWSDEKGYHVSAASIGDSKEESDTREAAIAAREIFSSVDKLSMQELKDTIKNMYACSARIAERRVKIMISEKLIIHVGRGMYSINPKQ